MDDKKAVEEQIPVKGIVLPVSIVGIFCVVSMILCVDFIEQAVRYAQEQASLLTIGRKTLAAVGWGLMAVSVAAKLWKHYRHTEENKK